MIRALLAETLPNGWVRCHACAHECRLAVGQTGICRVRKNVDGELQSLNSHRVAAVHVDPIEKKPLYHFLPGSRSLSLAAMGCNFSCSFCQNHALSQVHREEDIAGDAVPAGQWPVLARDQNCRSLSYTYSEPTVFFELMLETAQLAHAQGLRNVMVSNGFLTAQALEMLSPYLDGANIDLKSFRDDFYRTHCSGRLQPVLDTITAMKKRNIWVEVTTLLIPGLNDSPQEINDIIAFLHGLDPGIPWHVSRFFPQYRLKDALPTAVAEIHRCLSMAEERGLQFVYGGNLPDSRWSHTRCPGCGKQLIARSGYRIQTEGLEGNRCRYCAMAVPGLWS